MRVDFRKLKNFVKIVDTGSISRASSILRVAQPALSQQIASLEDHFQKDLLIRSNLGIQPTEAGIVLYRHAQAILKHLEQAEADVTQAAASLAGHVSIGLATYSTTTTLSIPLLRAVSQRYPDITLYINDNFGHILSELVMTGRMDMAIIYGSDPIKGVELQSLFREELILIAPHEMELPGSSQDAIPLDSLDGIKLLLPNRNHFLRGLIDASFSRARVVPHVAAEIESVSTLRAAIEANLGATILPAGVVVGTDLPTRRLVKPTIQASISLCVSDHLPLSEPASAVSDILRDLVNGLIIPDSSPGARSANSGN